MSPAKSKTDGAETSTVGSNSELSEPSVTIQDDSNAFGVEINYEQLLVRMKVLFMDSPLLKHKNKKVRKESQILMNQVQYE